MTRNLWLGVAAIVFCGSLTVPAQRTDTAESLLQAATKRELVDGDLAGAIAGYKKALAAAKGNRAVAAQALLQLGQCYRKQGNAEARLTFERLLRDYADQGAAVAKAREELAVLTKKEQQPKFTKIRVPSGLPGRTALSPDGQQLAYVSGGSVWLLPVHGASDPTIAGVPRQVTQPVKTWISTLDIAWSRDGNWLALHVWEQLAGGNDYAVYVVRSAGGEPVRIPLALKSRVQVFLDAFLSISPDGEWLAYTSWPEEEDSSRRAVYLALRTGGQSRRLTQPVAGAPAFSPDGRMVAYLGLLSDPEWGPDRWRGRQIWVVPVLGGSPVLVYEEPYPARLDRPMWSPDGRMLSFLVTRSTTSDWSREMLVVPVSPDGRPTAPPAKIDLPRSTGTSPAGWSPIDRIGLLLPSPEVTAVYTVPAVGGQAVQLTPEWSAMPAWSPDSKTIFFFGSHNETLANIEFIPAEGGKVARTPLRAPWPLQGYGVSISPDGKRMLFVGHIIRAPADQRSRLFTVPVEGGKVTELETGMSQISSPCWSRDGKTIAFVGRKQTANNVYTMPAEGGQARELTSDSDKVGLAGIAWSPDGNHLAFYTEGGNVALVAASGGPVRVLIEGLKGYRSHLGLSWSPDGKELAYATNNRIWKANIQSRKSEEVQTGLDAIHLQMAWSPDGKVIAFSALQGGEPELWLMEDFLPLVQGKR